MAYIPLVSIPFVSHCLLGAVLLFGGSHAQADSEYPLEPVDTSSPRATMTSFLVEMEGAWRLFRDEYWNAPSYELYTNIISRAGRVMRTLDLSEVAPSARIEVGYEAFTLLYETLSRIELPPSKRSPTPRPSKRLKAPRNGVFLTPTSPSPG